MIGLSEVDIARINHYSDQIEVIERTMLLSAVLFLICALCSVFDRFLFWVSLVFLVMTGLYYLGAEHYYRKIEEVLFYERD